jgi:hypothetical protein
VRYRCGKSGTWRACAGGWLARPGDGAWPQGCGRSTSTTRLKRRRTTPRGTAKLWPGDMCGLPKPTSNVPAQTKRHALRALRPHRWPPHGLPSVPKCFRRRAPASDEGLLQSGQPAVLKSQSETVLERRGIHGQVLHPHVDQVVGCLEAAVPSNIDGSETDRRRGKPALRTWTVGEESIPIRRQPHRSHSRTSADSAWILARSRLEVAAHQRLCRVHLRRHLAAL